MRFQDGSVVAETVATFECRQDCGDGNKEHDGNERSEGSAGTRGACMAVPPVRRVHVFLLLILMFLGICCILVRLR